MDLGADVRVIRAPSLKRGKSEGGLNERVSFLLFFLNKNHHFIRREIFPY